MPEPVRLGKEDLKSRYGVGERLAVRLGALAARGLAPTAAVLEEAVRSRELENLLLDPAFLEKAPGLDTAGLHREFPASKTLARVRDLLALAEELQAEGEWSQRRDLAAPGPGTLPSIDPGSGLDLAALRGAIPPEEVARLKLVLLTGVEPGPKIEALRKIALSGAPAEEKGLLALRALGDPSSDVRREAASLMESMGLGREIADALKTAAAGTPRQKEQSIRRVATLGSRAPTAERSIAVAFLVGGLAHETDPAVLRALVEALVPFSEALAGHPELLGALTRHLLRALADHHDALVSPARNLLDAIGERRPGERIRSIWAAGEGIGDRRLRVLLLESLLGMDLPADLERSLCRVAVDDLAVKPLEDLDSRRLADALRRRKDTALVVLLDSVEGLKEEARALLVPVLDAVAATEGVAPALLERTGEYFLKLLREGGRHVRSSVIESRICWHPETSADLKRRLAIDFLSNLHSYTASRIHDLTAAAIRRIGPAAVDPLEDCVRRSAYPVERETAVRILADIADDTADPALAARVLTFLRGLDSTDRVPPPVLVRALGRAVHGPAAPAGAAKELLSAFLSQLGKVAWNYDLVAGLGWAGSAPTLDPASATDVALRLVDLLETPMPDLETEEKRGDEGMHLFVGGATGVYTEFLPELIGGLGRIVSGGRLPAAVRLDIVRRLALRYRSVAEFREVWAPTNLSDLGAALASIAASPGCPSEERRLLVDALLGNLRSATTARILSSAFARSDDEDDAVSALLGRYVDLTLAMLARPDFRERDEQRVLLESLARVAGHRRLGTEPEQSDERRRRILELLLEHSTLFRELKPLLKRLAASPHLPAELASRAGGASA